MKRNDFPKPPWEAYLYLLSTSPLGLQVPRGPTRSEDNQMFADLAIRTTHTVLPMHPTLSQVLPRLPQPRHHSPALFSSRAFLE